jgi:hypothetical protein
MSALPDPSQASSRPSLKDRLSTWLLCIVALVMAPLFPLFVEGTKNSWVVAPENVLLTAAVLAVGYGFSSEGTFFRAAYAMTFLLAVGLDFQPTASQIALPTATSGPSSLWASIAAASGWVKGHVALEVLFGVTVLQSIERFNWHVGLDRRFPDWLK